MKVRPSVKVTMWCIALLFPTCLAPFDIREEKEEYKAASISAPVIRPEDSSQYYRVYVGGATQATYEAANNSGAEWYAFKILKSARQPLPGNYADPEAEGLRYLSEADMRKALWNYAAKYRTEGMAPVADLVKEAVLNVMMNGENICFGRTFDNPVPWSYMYVCWRYWYGYIQVPEDERVD